jgi:pimeloyl-ACP methyl ester carboxylesterase
MPELEGSAGRLHYVVTGSGGPTTVFVPGLAASIADTRPFASAVEGTRVFIDLRGHGGSAGPKAAAGWTYSALADDVQRVADAVGASRAVGVSLGAGSVTTLLSTHPTRFERVVLALPGVTTRARSETELAVTDALADAIVAVPGGDQSVIASTLLLLQPESVRARADVKLWARRHAAELGGNAATADAVRALPRQHVLESLSVLSSVDTQALVLAQRDDVVHPIEAAQSLAAAVAGAELMVRDTPWIWGARSELRNVVSGFLNR